MLFLRDRFLKVVIATTLFIIIGMYVVHITSNGVSQPNISSEQNLESVLRAERESSCYQSRLLPSKGPFRVTRVIDGDTLVLSSGETVRLIGVDAPESHHPEIPVQRFAQEAAEFLRRLAEGFECTLEYDSEIRDGYDRLLAYVFVGNRLVNAEMIRRGYAYAYTRYPFRRQGEFVILEEEARKRQYGLWHLSLRDGRIANLVHRYDSLNVEGRRKLDDILHKLVEKYPSEQQTLKVRKKPEPKSEK